MSWPQESDLRLLSMILTVLLAAALLLLALTPLRRRRGKSVRSMWVKYGSWFLMIPAVVVPMLLGRFTMQAAFLLMSLYALQEFSRAVGLWRESAHLWLARACIVLVYVPVFIDWYGTFMAMPAYVILMIFALPIMRDTYKGMIQRSCLTMLAVLYFGWFLAHLAYLTNVRDGRGFLLAFLLLVVINDASAYLVGSTFGRTPLTPHLSPNKTVEGVLGALIATMAMTFTVRFALAGIGIMHTILLGFTLSVCGTYGDLAISLIKRDVHIKDSGSLIPGHGGLLDRLDSVLFAAPVFFHFMNYFYGILGR